MTEPAQSPRREPDPAVVDAGDGDGKGIYWVLKNVLVGPPVKRIFRPNVLAAGSRSSRSPTTSPGPGSKAGSSAGSSRAPARCRSTAPADRRPRARCGPG